MFANCTAPFGESSEVWKVTMVVRVRQCHFLTSFQEGPHQKIVLTWEKKFFFNCASKSQRRKKNDKKAKMKGGLGWIRGLRGQEQDMSSLTLEWEPFF